MRSMKPNMRGSDMSDSLAKLYQEITKERGEPLDTWEIAALLEVYGIRDIDAKEYGYADVFELAKALWRYKNIKSYPKRSLTAQQPPPPFKIRVRKNFIKGLAFAMPMLLQSVATIFFGFALWSNIHMDVTEATIIALSTFLAMILTGGPAQVIGRKGLYYLKMNEDILAAKIIELLFGISMLKILFISLLFVVFNWIFGVLDWHLFIIFITMFFLLSTLFLSVSIYYVFEEYEKILYFFFYGLGWVFLLHYLLGFEYLQAQFWALAILDASIIYFAYKKLQDLRNKTQSEGEILPRPSMLVYTLIPFFVYGFLYFLFLTIDRLIAWNANSTNQGFFLWFDARYEVGSDLALLVFVILMGVVEVVVYEFLYKLNDKVFSYSVFEFEQFNRSFLEFYKKVNTIFIVVTFLSIIGVYALVALLLNFVEERALPFGGYGVFVFFVGSLAFAFLANGLMNALILFSFSRQKVVVKGAFFAVLVNFVLGMVLSRILEPYFAVLGLLAGSVVFWYVTFRFLIKMFGKLDYYYYSAY